MFQHTAARRRLVMAEVAKAELQEVSTHSRPKAAGLMDILTGAPVLGVSTHSRPKAAGLMNSKSR